MMNYSSGFFTISALAVFGATVSASPPRPHEADNADRQPAVARATERWDFSERSDSKLADDIKKARDTSRAISIDLTWSKVGDGLLKHLKGSNELHELNLFGTDVSDIELRHLRELKHLESIDLGGCKVTTKGILQLRASRKLKRLGLAGIRPPLDDKGIERIVATWPQLESISLDGSRLTNTGLRHIGKLQRLKYLNISRTRIGDGGLESLAGLSRLRTLHTSHTRITDQGMVHLGKLTGIEKLDLNFTGITDKGLIGIRRLKHLKRIYFVGTKVTDDGLEHLKPVKTIEFVGPNEEISDAALKSLKDALPLFKSNKRG